MLGPGLGQVVARMITGEPAADDDVVLNSFSPYRDFGKMEALK